MNKSYIYSEGQNDFSFREIEGHLVSLPTSSSEEQYILAKTHDDVYSWLPAGSIIPTSFDVQQCSFFQQDNLLTTDQSAKMFIVNFYISNIANYANKVKESVTVTIGGNPVFTGKITSLEERFQMIFTCENSSQLSIAGEIPTVESIFAIF